MFNVLRPVYEPAGTTTLAEGVVMYWQRVARWVVVGQAESAMDARRKFPPVLFGYAVVLETPK